MAGAKCIIQFLYTLSLSMLPKSQLSFGWNKDMSLTSQAYPPTLKSITFKQNTFIPTAQLFKVRVKKFI